ncbi:MerR family transcriptional regulator [Rhizobium sp. RU36D]|uniref:MerR family transcriptional regulator n=1 Tax=Rhizobium sp. RU36D TaxID=1907415 RepID=UPI0009D7ED74|nr:MerR family transcriptional regulator [Rhizobium sp. RU36D]SMD01993.1 DNA-binding transcriptional regulator, MerR family [Rhizobium sp. RU36D]
MDDIRFKIADAARLVGVSPSTLRLWETQDLIQPIRTPTGQRLYDRAMMARLQTIARLRTEKGLNPSAIRESLRQDDEDAGPADGQENENGEMQVGARIRRLRREAGKTLEAVSLEAGTSISQLSMFERTSQGLSLKALHAVARSLGTTLAALSGQERSDGRESLIRQGQWLAWPDTSPGVAVQALAAGRNQMECNRFVLGPGASSEGAYAHEGEEFVHVLTGSVEFILDGDQFFELNSGDSFYFESRRPHSWRNSFDGETVLLWINTPATF